MLFWCPCLAQPVRLVQYSCSASPEPLGLLKTQSENHRLWCSPRALSAPLLFQRALRLAMNVTRCPSAQGALAPCFNLLSLQTCPLRRAVPSPGTPLPTVKEKLCPQNKNYVKHMFSIFNGTLESFPWEKAGLGLLPADLCLTSIWHPGAWLLAST